MKYLGKILDNKDLTTKEYIRNNGIPFGIVDSTSTSTAYTATVDGITELKDGTAVLLKNGVVTSAAGFTINVNNLGAKPAYNNMADATAETTLFNINYTMLFVYDTTRVEGGAWILYRGYNSDTTVGRGVIDYYYRPYAGQAIYRYKLCMQGADNRLYPIVTTNQTSATQVAKKPTTTPLRASTGIWYYGSTSTVSAGSAVGAQLLYPSYYFTTAVYNFNGSTGTYKNIYLRGSYNKDTDMFTLYDDGAATPTSYYAFVPNNTANITLSSYFVNGYYYMLVGASYSTTNYVSLFDNNPLYYFDGTNLIPVSTKVAKDIADTAVAGKQDTLTFDNVPTANSNNPVKSGGVYTAIQNAISSVDGVFWGQYNTTTISEVANAISSNLLPIIEKDGGYYIYVGNIGDVEDVYVFSSSFTLDIGGARSANASLILDSNNTWSAHILNILTEDDINTTVNSIVSDYLPLTGGTLTGGLTLNGNPTSNLQATPKQYVDSKAPFFFVEQDGSNNPTLQEILQKYFNGETPFLKAGDVNYIATPITAVDDEDNIVGLEWPLLITFFGVYSTMSIQLTNSTLPTGNYDATQDTWSQGQLLVGLVDNNTMNDAISSYCSDFMTDSDVQSYVSSAIAGKLDKSGGTMTGALTLSGAPTANLHAATKKYVDDNAGSKASIPTTFTAGNIAVIDNDGNYMDGGLKFDVVNGILEITY